jgi:hypothetical protein
MLLTEGLVVGRPGRVKPMANYRVYIIGIDGRFIRAIQLECADDNAAIESAKQFDGGHDVELWSGDRFITRLAARRI